MDQHGDQSFKPGIYVGDLANLPAALQPLCARAQWVIWRLTWRHTRWIKPPFRCDDPYRFASSDDPSSWSTYEAAVAAAVNGDGITYVLTPDDPFAAVDIDHVRDPVTGTIESWAQRIIDQASHSYVEVSPSGFGLRIWGTASGEKVHSQFNFDGSALELFRRTSKPLTVTGLQLGNSRQLGNIDALLDRAVIWGRQRHHKLSKTKKSQHNFSAGTVAQCSVDEIERIVEDGAPDGANRSDIFHGIVGHFIGCGWTIEQIVEHLSQYPDGIGARYIAEGRLAGEVARSAAAFGTATTNPEDLELEDTDAETVLSLGEWDAGDDIELPPPRGWLYGNIFARRFVSSLYGEGGTGKTALRYAQYLSLAIGRSLTGDHVFQRSRVLIVSLEDDVDELRRRILAAVMYHNIDRRDLKGWLFLSAPGGTAGKLLTLDNRGRLVRGGLAGAVEDAVVKHKIDLVALDPFIKTHSVEENSNSAIDDVVQILTDMTAKHDIAIDTPHHTSKGPADPGNANRGRGAGAMKDGGRLIYTLATMTTDEAKAFGVLEDERRYLIRMDSGKVNIAPPISQARWFRLVGVELGNATELYPSGDVVQTVEPWVPPQVWTDLSIDLLNHILTTIDQGFPDGNRYTDAASAKKRAAWRVIVEQAPNKTEAQAREIIRVWVKIGVLVSYPYDNPETRKQVDGLRVDNTKRPENKGTAHE